MSKRQELLALYSMLDHCAREATRNRFELIATLSAAAAEEAREQIAALERGDRGSGPPSGRRDGVSVDSAA